MAHKNYSYFYGLFAEGVRVAAIMSTGDLIAQKIVEKRKNTDWIRILKFGCVGLVLVGPLLRFWYIQMDNIISPNQKPIIRGFKKMMLDQITFSPVFNCVVIGAFSALNGDSFAAYQNRLRKDYINIMLKSYTVWPAMQMLNFTVVPVNFQVPFVQTCGVFWNCYLSYVLNQ